MDLDAGKEKGEQHNRGGNGAGDMPVTKGEMKNEMRSMILELLEMSMIGSRPHELKQELMPNDVKLEGSNYLNRARRVNVLLGGKGVEHYLTETEDYVETANKLRKREPLGEDYG